jgi:hypothetical protein
MPLVRISLLRGKPASYRRKVGDAVHRALVETIDVPTKDRFQILSEHDPEDLVYDREYLGIARSRDLVIIQITLSAGRSLYLKRALYRAIAGGSPRRCSSGPRTSGSTSSKRRRRTGLSATASLRTRPRKRSRLRLTLQ